MHHRHEARARLAKHEVTSVIVGARDPAQLEDNLGAVGWALDGEEVARLDAMMPPPRLYPQWFIAMMHAPR